MTSKVCSSCLKPIRWFTTVGGKSMPLDPDPTPNGNVVKVTLAGELRVRVLDPTAARPAVPTYVSHFSTCPHATTHRRVPAPRTPNGPSCRAQCGTALSTWLTTRNFHWHITCAPHRDYRRFITQLAMEGTTPRTGVTIP